MSKELKISTDTRGDVYLISIGGDVTAVTGAAVEKAYHEACDGMLKKILLVFDGENYINSGGIAILIGIVAESRKKEQTIRMTGLSDHFQKIFKMVGLTKYAEVFPTDEAALEGF